MPNTVHLHRVLATSPEKVYRAFLEADALAKWLPPNGFACTVHHLEPKVGGTFKMSFRNVLLELRACELAGRRLPAPGPLTGCCSRRFAYALSGGRSSIFNASGISVFS